MNTRRELIRIGAAWAALHAQEHHKQEQEPPSTAQRRARFFRPEELQLLAKLVDHIIPRSTTPGAADANVHYYIDWVAYANPALGARLRKDLAWIRKRKFLVRDSAGQVALLTEWSQSTGEPRRIFQIYKDLTIDGYYGTQEGLTQELGWNANTFVRDYKGCTHPEHA